MKRNRQGFKYPHARGVSLIELMIAMLLGLLVVGAAFAIPAILLLTRWHGSAWWRAVDAHFGNISYGVFLNHFLLMWLLSWQAPLRIPQLLGLVICSTVLSLFTFHYLEKPVLQWRRNLLRS